MLTSILPPENEDAHRVIGRLKNSPETCMGSYSKDKP